MSQQNNYDESKTLQFFEACKNGDILMINILINYDEVDVNRKYLHGNTPFHFVCFGDSEHIVKIFLKNKRINLNILNDLGKTPFFMARELGKSYIIKLLLNDERINKNIADRDNEHTPLSAACLYRQLETIKLLIDYKKREKDPNLKNMIKYCMEVIEDYNYYDVYNLLKNAELSLSENIYYSKLWDACITAQFKEIAKLIISNDFTNDLCSITIDGETLLSKLIKMNYLEIIDIILKGHKNNLSRILNIKDDKGKSLIMLAIKHSSPKLVEYLIKFEEINYVDVDNKGNNILHHVASRDNLNITDIVLKHLYPNVKLNK